MYGGTYLDRSDVLQEVLTAFKSEKPKKKSFGNFRIEGDRLLYMSEKKVQSTSWWGNDGDRKRKRDEVREYLIKEKEGKFKFESSDVKRNMIESLKKKETLYIRGNEIQERIIAKKVGDVILGNSAMLDFPNRRNGRELVQVEMEKIGFKMIPFNVFKEAKVDLDDLEIIDQSGSEDVVRQNGFDYKLKKNGEREKDKAGEFIQIPKYETMHFTGASLLRAKGKYFLFDIDRRELEFKAFNPFIVILPRKVSTVKEAYEILKPREVVLAEKKGMKVLRQGEWFFIPVKKGAPRLKLTEKEKLIILASHAYFQSDTHPGIDKKFYESVGEKAKRLTKRLYATKALQIQGHNSNTVQICHEKGKKVFCLGKVKHDGREHKDLILKSWHLAVPNTAFKSFTVTGDID